MTLDLDALEALWRDQRYSQTHKLLDAMPELIRLARIGQRILSLPIVGEATDPGEQELPAAAARASEAGEDRAAGGAGCEGGSEMTDEFAGRVLAFKGDDEYVSETNVLVEVTEVENGCVELAFNLPVKNGPRIYLSVSLDVVVRKALDSK